MTLDHALRLLAMTVDTIAALQQQIDALHAEIARLTEEPGEIVVRQSAGRSADLPSRDQMGFPPRDTEES